MKHSANTRGSIPALTKIDFKVVVESEAGISAGFPDEAYRKKSQKKGESAYLLGYRVRIKLTLDKAVGYALMQIFWLPVLRRAS